MNKIQPKYFRILAIAPSTRGFGFAVLEGQDTLVDWGIKTVKKRDKNKQSLAKMEKLIAHYQPGALVLEDASAKVSRRSPRIRKLSRQIIKMAADRKVSVKLFSRDQVMKAFIADGTGTKHALAEIIAKRFPEELGSRLPPKRKPWMSEDSRMDIFDAVALILAFRLTKGQVKNPEVPKESKNEPIQSQSHNQNAAT
jgi:Holliday junction resolvasome RuvABC endonuclease subunit